MFGARCVAVFVCLADIEHPGIISLLGAQHEVCRTSRMGHANEGAHDAAFLSVVRVVVLASGLQEEDEEGP